MSKILSFFGRSNSECSLSELVAPHLSRMYRQAYKYCGTEHDAEDLLQDVLIECSERESQLREAPVPAAWLSRVLYHRFVDRHRKQKRHADHQDIDTIELATACNDSPESSYLHNQVLTSLDLLSKDQRAVIALHDLEGYTIAEISELLDIPVGTLKSHLHRGRKALKNSLQLQPKDIAQR